MFLFAAAKLEVAMKLKLEQQKKKKKRSKKMMSKTSNAHNVCCNINRMECQMFESSRLLNLVII